MAPHRIHSAGLGDGQLMSRRIDCPLKGFEKGFIELPDEWLGIHAQRRDEAVEVAIESGLKETLLQFSITLALLDNWGGIPGIDGNPDQWDFTVLPLPLIAWMNGEVLTDYLACFEVPKKSLAPSPNGQEEKSPTKATTA